MENGGGHGGDQGGGALVKGKGETRGMQNQRVCFLTGNDSSLFLG